MIAAEATYAMDAGSTVPVAIRPGAGPQAFPRNAAKASIESSRQSRTGTMPPPGKAASTASNARQRAAASRYHRGRPSTHHVAPGTPATWNIGPALLIAMGSFLVPLSGSDLAVRQVCLCAPHERIWQPKPRPWITSAVLNAPATAFVRSKLHPRLSRRPVGAIVLPLWLRVIHAL